MNKNPEEGEQFKLQVETTLICRRVDGKAKAKAVTNLLKGDNINLLQFFTQGTGNLNLEGYKTITELMIQGLNANIQGAHQTGIIDSAEHLRKVIARLEQLFINVVDVRNVPADSIHLDD